MILALLAYAAAMVAANLSVAAFGLAVVPFNAFALIGLDLALRDWLHVRLSRQAMAALILCTGAFSWVLNPDAGKIAVASTVAFVAAGVADWGVFSVVPGTWIRRAVISNVAGAAVDSVLFPIIAFGGLALPVAAPMFVAKVAGGALWAFALNRLSRT